MTKSSGIHELFGHRGSNLTLSIRSFNHLVPKKIGDPLIKTKNSFDIWVNFIFHSGFQQNQLLEFQLVAEVLGSHRTIRTTSAITNNKPVSK